MIKKRTAFFEYILTFIGFIGMYFFIMPDSDVFFFSRDYENSLSSFVSNALNYGNGRFLGNVIGFAFSHLFFFSFILIAAVLTLLTVFVNRFFFKGDHRTVMPVALLVAFPCSGMVSEVYLQLPTFANYVIPMMLIFAVLCMIKYGKESKLKPVAAVLVLVLAFASCLFSENNTISIFVLSVLAAVYSRICTKKIDLLNIVFVLGTVAGGLAMLLIPKITGASHNLDYYRGTAGSISSMITLAIASYSTFTEIFSTFIIPVIIISASLIFLLTKKSDSKGKLKKPAILILAFFPIEAVFYIMLSKNAPASIYMYLLQAGIVTLYALAIFIAILCLEKSNLKTLLLGLYILVLSSVGPMLFVDKYGYRTFYLSFVIILSFALTLLKAAVKELPDNFKEKLNSKNIGKAMVCAACIAFVCLSAFVFIQSVYNYDFYVIRTQYISSQIAKEAEEAEVPVLPCRGISYEDENPTLVETIQYKNHSKTKITLSESIYCENSGEYYSILDSNPVSNLIFALQNLNFKNPVVITELVNP